MLNVAGVALALTAITATVFAALTTHLNTVLVGIAPTLLIGALWAFVLRIPKTIGTTLRVGWAIAPVLAALNAGVTCMVLFGPGLASFAIGVSLGAIVWLPALLATLVLFGFPLSRAERLAKEGLDGSERGEQVVGITVSILAGIVLSLTVLAAKVSFMPATALAIAALVVGVSSYFIAARRRRARTNFVADVEAGKVVNFRVDATPQGKALIRVDGLGDAYRVMDYEEEIAVLSERGTVRRGLKANVPD